MKDYELVRLSKRMSYALRHRPDEFGLELSSDGSVEIGRLIEGINRTTFYACYDNFHDIADSIRRELEDNMIAMYQEEIESRQSRSDYLRLFRHIKDNQIFYRAYFKLGYDDQLKGFGYDTKAADEYFDNKFIPNRQEDTIF